MSAVETDFSMELYKAAADFTDAFPNHDFRNPAHVEEAKRWLIDREDAVRPYQGTLLELDSEHHVIDWTCGGTRETPHLHTLSRYVGPQAGHFMSYVLLQPSRDEAEEDRLELGIISWTRFILDGEGEGHTDYAVPVALRTPIIGSIIDQIAV